MDTTIATLGECRIPSPLKLSTRAGDDLGDYTPETARVRYQAVYGTFTDLQPADASFEMAGPREKLYFDPAKTKAAIVTCGGLCPGLNNVIRSAYLELNYNYGVSNVVGIRYGYAGLNPASGLAPVPLSRDYVDHIHEHGGSVLGTSRGPQPPEVMAKFLVDNGINILICVGGDGTLRGAKTISDETQRRGMPVAVVGVPKTIDNDILYVQRTFGVATAIERAAQILECAHIEARSALNGIGLVKLMGREAGFVAAGATLASQEVNLTLIPEIPFKLEGPDGVFEFLRKRLESRQHALIVVAEGAGQELMTTEGTDKSGNKKLGDIGVYLKARLADYFKGINMPADIKYFDPSYYIRSVRASAGDCILCDQLARHAVHAAMAGKTGLVIGVWNAAFTHVPIALATSGKKRVDPEEALWTSVLAATGQPRRF